MFAVRPGRLLQRILDDLVTDRNRQGSCPRGNGGIGGRSGSMRCLRGRQTILGGAFRIGMEREGNEHME